MADNRDYWSFAEEQGNVRISEDVVASIAAISASETEGVGALVSGLGTDIAEFLGKKSLAKGVRVKFDGDQADVDVYLYVKYGYNVCEVAKQVQHGVKTAVESMTGLRVAEVNVHVCGIVFEPAAAEESEK